MRSPRALVVLILALVAISVVAAIALGARDDAGDDDRLHEVEVGGMRMDRGELGDLVAETMGERRLEDVPVASSADAARDLDGTLRDGVRSFELHARPVRWEYRDGQRVAAWAYEGQVPGPTLRAREGERVRVVFTNELPVATTVHWHGVDVPWRQDGVPGVSQAAVEPGESYEYEFAATPAGTRWYHTHGSEMGDETAQLDMGLAGAIVIEPRAGGAEPPQVDETFVLDEWNVAAGGYNAAMLGGHASHGGADNVFTIDGAAAPDVRELRVRRGDRVRVRWVNASTRTFHPMHVHGHQFRIVALDGNPLAQPVDRNVVLLAPGETADVEFVADNPGVWAIHCHDLHHADAGMMMLLRYEGFDESTASTLGEEGEDGDDGAAHGMDHS